MEISQQRIIELLRFLGFTEYEAEAYAAVALFGPIKAVKASELTKIPRPRIYDTLSRLKERGYVKETEGGFVATPPTLIAEKIREQEKIKEKKIIDSTPKLIKEIKDSKKTKRKDLAYAIRGREKVIKRLQQMSEDGKYAKVLTSYAHSLVLKHPELIKRLEKLDLKVITTMALEDIPKAKVKIYPVREEFGIMIVDGRETVVATIEGEAPQYNVCVYINDPKISSGLEGFFDFIWGHI